MNFYEHFALTKNYIQYWYSSTHLYGFMQVVDLQCDILVYVCNFWLKISVWLKINQYWTSKSVSLLLHNIPTKTTHRCIVCIKQHDQQLCFCLIWKKMYSLFHAAKRAHLLSLFQKYKRFMLDEMTQRVGGTYKRGVFKILT